MKHFYIQFSLLIFFLSLSGSLLGQTYSYSLTNPTCATCSDGRIDVDWTYGSYDVRVLLYSSRGTLLKTESYVPFEFANLSVGDYSIEFQYYKNRGWGWTEYTTQNVTLSFGLCIPSVTNSNARNNEYISRVQIGDIDNSSNSDGYTDYTDSYSTDVEIDNDYLLTITNGNYDYDTYGVWVDWNQDGDFNDLDEVVVTESGDDVYTVTITPPTHATLGNSRMRIRVNYYDLAPVCGTTSWGEVEDYTLNITPGLPGVSLNVGATSINENAGSTAVVVSLEGVLAQDVVVGLSVGGDVSTSDYSISSLSLTIPAGSTSASVNFIAKNNEDADGDKDAIIEIVSVSSNVSENGTQEKTITIEDDEEPSDIRIAFEQRTSQNTPTQKIYNIKGDFTMIGNTNLTLNNYRSDRNNSNYDMKYVDVDSDASTFNSSSATLTFSEENGAKPQCSDIIYAGLYWTGRANNSNMYDFKVWDGSKYLDKREILIKHADKSSYQEVTARDEDIYYPDGSESDIYAAYAEVTDYVQTNGIGEYFVADMALSDGNGGSTGFCGGWGLVVVYKNSKMKWRDVTLYDGYAYVSHSGGGNTSYDFPISGFKAVQSGDVNIKLGLIASEGDVGISGDFIEVQNAAQNNWTKLSHDGNTENNFFNSSISTGDNARNPNLTNNTGVDISMFDVPNDGNLNIANEQTRTKFRYGTSQDAYAIFALAMAVDAYVPEAEATNAIMTIGGQPIADGSMVLPGQEIVYQLDIRNRGTEAVNDLRIVLPIAYTTDYVDSDATVDFSPAVNNYYYDPSEGATGSIIWEIGNLPVPPEGPDQILGSLTYIVKVTEDCAILGNPDCSPSVGIGGGGGSTGTGANSGTSITGFSIIQGYVTDGECVGEPITTPIEIQIDAEDYVKENCTVEEIDSGQEYFFCNLGASGSIPIGEVSDNFPTGCRFYDDYPIVDGSTEEFTVSNDFLADVGTRTYYAVPPGYTSCFYTFKITVKDISSVPSASDETYCQGNLAGKLIATPSEPTYKLYYYTEETGGTSLVSLIPNTDIVGVDTYYVAEGESASCLSPNRVPIKVTVNPSPTVPTGNASQSFCGSATIGDLDATSSDAVDWYSASTGGTALTSGDALLSGTYYAEGRNATTGCVSSGRLAVSVTIQANTTISLSSAVGTNYQIICANTSIDDVIYNVSNGTGATVTGLPADVTGSYSSGTFTISGTPSEPGIYSYVITATGTCGSAEVGGTIIVNDLPVVTISDDLAICSGDETTISVDSTDYSMSFDGSNDYLKIPNSSSINTMTVSTRTIMFWFKAENISSKQVLYEEGGGTHGMAIYLESNKIHALNWINGSITSEVNADINSAGEWCHLSVTWNSNGVANEKLKLYLNGNLIAQGGNGAAIPAHSGDVRIGNAANTLASIGSGNSFKGNIDNFRLWNLELSQAEIISEIGSESASTSGVVIDYTFDDPNDATSVTNSGSIASDATKNGADYDSDYSILWDDDDASTTFSIKVSPTVTTTYNVKLTNENGCQAIGKVEVTVNPTPKPIGIFFNE